MSFKLEPALWVGAVEAILVLLIAFGIPISAEQKTAIIGVVTTVLVIVGSVVIRQQVTPVAKLQGDQNPPPEQPVEPVVTT